MRIAQVNIKVKPDCVDAFIAACSENAAYSIREKTELSDLTFFSPMMTRLRSSSSRSTDPPKLKRCIKKRRISSNGNLTLKILLLLQGRHRSTRMSCPLMTTGSHPSEILIAAMQMLGIIRSGLW